MPGRKKDSAAAPAQVRTPGRVSWGYLCFAGGVEPADLQQHGPTDPTMDAQQQNQTPTGAVAAARPARMERIVCSWPARWLSLMAAVLALSAWTADGAGAPSRMLILALVLLGVLGVTTRHGWALLRRGCTAEHRVAVIGGAAAAVFCCWSCKWSCQVR